MDPMLVSIGLLMLILVSQLGRIVILLMEAKRDRARILLLADRIITYVEENVPNKEEPK